MSGAVTVTREILSRQSNAIGLLIDRFGDEVLGCPRPSKTQDPTRVAILDYPNGEALRAVEAVGFSARRVHAAADLFAAMSAPMSPGALLVVWRLAPVGIFYAFEAARNARIRICVIHDCRPTWMPNWIDVCREYMPDIERWLRASPAALRLPPARLAVSVG